MALKGDALQWDVHKRMEQGISSHIYAITFGQFLTLSMRSSRSFLRHCAPGPENRLEATEFLFAYRVVRLVSFTRAFTNRMWRNLLINVTTECCQLSPSYFFRRTSLSATMITVEWRALWNRNETVRWIENPKFTCIYYITIILWHILLLAIQW